MKIVIVGLKNLNEPGGIETHVKNVAPLLAKMGNEVHLIVNKDNKVSLKGVKIHKVPYIRWRYLSKISMLPFSLWEIHRIKPDVIYANDAVHGFGTTLVFRKRIPVVYVAHGIGYLRSDWPKPIKWFLKVMERYTFKHATKVFAVDEESAKEVEKVRGEKIEVIPNGVDIKKFSQKFQKPKEFQHKINVVFIGRLIPSKGIYDLIEVFKKIKTKDIGLYIIGKGPEEEKLRKLAKGMQNVHILGFVKDIRPYLRNADIFVMPSYYEGMPIVLLEAMASKTACIVYNVGDISERFKNGRDLIIIKKGNKGDLLKWILKLSRDKKIRKRLSTEAFSKVKDKYSWKVITNKILKIMSLKFTNHADLYS